MADDLHVYKAIYRQMQRLGYLKRLVRRVVSLQTSNMENLGFDLVDTVTRRFKIRLNDERVSYTRTRLTDRVYKTIKDQVNLWAKEGGDFPEVMMELQDLYLADSSLPSQVGKLVRDDWRFYTSFGTNLGFIREGTFSANTRAITLLHLTPDKEQQAFTEFVPEFNPLKLSFKQSLLFLYSLIEADGDVAIPLWLALPKEGASFNDREIGDFIPNIYRSIIARYRNRLIGIDLKTRLEVIGKSADSIAAQSEKQRYEGATSREHAARPRVEPYCDIGLFAKPNKMKYEYTFSEVGQRWVECIADIGGTANIGEFLDHNFFNSIQHSWSLTASRLSNPDEIVPYLWKAWKAISSSSGYAPIEEIALLAGIEALVDNQRTFEIATARDALIAYQKANPYRVRFTVDRLGKLAHAKFVEETLNP